MKKNREKKIIGALLMISILSASLLFSTKSVFAFQIDDYTNKETCITGEMAKWTPPFTTNPTMGAETIAEINRSNARIRESELIAVTSACKAAYPGDTAGGIPTIAQCDAAATGGAKQSRRACLKNRELNVDQRFAYRCSDGNWSDPKFNPTTEQPRCDGTGTGTGTGTDTGTGTGGGGDTTTTPPAVGCDIATLDRLSFEDSPGLIFKDAKDQQLRGTIGGEIGTPVGIESLLNVTYRLPSVNYTLNLEHGLPVIEVGPLAHLTISRQIPLLKSICNAVSSLSEDIKQIKINTKGTWDESIKIQTNTKGIWTDTSWLVLKEKTLDPAARAAAAKALTDGKATNNTKIKNGRNIGLKETVNGVTKDAKATYTPEITSYQEEAGKTAATKFTTLAQNYFAKKKDSPLGDIVTNQLNMQAGLMTQTTQDQIAMIEGASNPYDSILLANALLDNKVRTAKENAVAEWTGNGGVIGGKNCPKDGVVKTKTGQSICVTDLQITDPAPIVKVIMEKYAATEITQMEMSNEYKENTVPDIQLGNGKSNDTGTCSDGKQNGDETGIDTGGRCGESADSCPANYSPICQDSNLFVSYPPEGNSCPANSTQTGCTPNTEKYIACKDRGGSAFTGPYTFPAWFAYYDQVEQQCLKDLNSYGGSVVTDTNVTPSPGPVVARQNNTANKSTQLATQNTQAPVLLSANLASVGSLTSSKKIVSIAPKAINLTATNSVTNTSKLSTITLSASGSVNPTSCIATSDWPTFLSTDKYSTITKSNLFAIGNIIPAPSVNNPQIFTITHPQLFKLSANITEPEATSVHRQAPTDQTSITNTIAKNFTGLTQTSTYIPNLMGAQVGDNIKLTINDIVVSFDLTNLNPIDLVRRIITEATAGKSDIKKALSAYNFAQDGNMLIVATKNPTPTTIPSTATYSLECNINNKAVSGSVNVIFP